jgi:hypothetical protein
MHTFHHIHLQFLNSMWTTPKPPLLPLQHFHTPLDEMYCSKPSLPCPLVLGGSYWKDSCICANLVSNLFKTSSNSFAGKASPLFPSHTLHRPSPPTEALLWIPYAPNQPTPLPTVYKATKHHNPFSRRSFHSCTSTHPLPELPHSPLLCNSREEEKTPIWPAGKKRTMPTLWTLSALSFSVQALY